jgi:hypothetical protein
MLAHLPHGVGFDSRSFRRCISLKSLLGPVTQISAVPYYILCAYLHCPLICPCIFFQIYAIYVSSVKVKDS